MTAQNTDPLDELLAARLTRRQFLRGLSTTALASLVASLELGDAPALDGLHARLSPAHFAPGAASAIDPQKWFVQFLGDRYKRADRALLGHGLPWGRGTALAGREITGLSPWDEGCTVSALVGPDAVPEIRKSLQAAIEQAGRLPEAQRGHIYIITPHLRIAPYSYTATRDSAFTIPQELLRGLLNAGISVRLLLWLPMCGAVMGEAAFSTIVQDNLHAAHLLRVESERLGARDQAVVALDLRTADLSSAAHNQHMMIIRVGHANVGYCGAPARILEGEVPGGRENGGTCEQIYGPGVHAPIEQYIKLEGPVVITLEEQFCERWAEPASKIRALGRGSNISNWHTGEVIFSTEDAFTYGTDGGGTAITPLPAPLPIPSEPLARGQSLVQMWRTVPLRDRKQQDSPMFQHGEFTLMAGLVNACEQSRELIWISTQQFWSRPFARLLNRRIKEEKNLHVLLILPPYSQHGNTPFGTADHHARRTALRDLMLNLNVDEKARIGVYNLWDRARGHAVYGSTNSQTYDGSLLVCGSASLAGRSFMCDTELSCAVLDPCVVDKHHQELWTLLFPNLQAHNTPWPGLNLNAAGSGYQFFSAFQRAVSSPNAMLIADPWDTTECCLPTRPNPLKRKQDLGSGLEKHFKKTLHPNSLGEQVEGPVTEHSILRACLLSDVVARIETGQKQDSAHLAPLPAGHA